MENATPVGVKVPRDVLASAFRNVSYQRATHESMLADSAVNQSPVEEATASQAASTVADAPKSDKLTANNSEVRK